MLRRKVRRIQYEGIHLICFKCGVYDDHQEICTGAKTANNLAGARLLEREGSHGQAHNRKASIPAEITEKFGPWMMVTRSSRIFDNNNQGRDTKSGKQDNKVTLENIPFKQNRFRGNFAI